MYNEVRSQGDEYENGVMCMKRFLTLLVTLLMAFCLIFALAACDGRTDTPPSADQNGDGDNTGNSGDAGGTENPDGGNTDSTPTGPRKLDTLAGKTAEELYSAIATYISALQNFTFTGESMTVSHATDGSESSETLHATVKLATNTFAVTGVETFDGETVLDMSVIYDNRTVYVDMGEGLRYRMDMAYDEFLELFGGNMLEVSVDYIPFSSYAEAAIYEDDGKYYLDLKGNVVGLEEEVLAKLLPFGGVLSEFSYRIYVDATGKMLSEESTVKYSQTEGWQMVTCEESSLVTLTDVGTTRVTAPEDAEDYPDLSGGEPDPEPDEPEIDYNEIFAVTFTYVDTDGNPIADVYGYTEKTESVRYGNAAHPPYMNSITAFDNYVIIGWADEDGYTYESDDFAYITENLTLYSVVRPKATFDVTFYYSDGRTVFDIVAVKEGDGISTDAVRRPCELGKTFKEWRFVSVSGASSTSCVVDECAFVAVMKSVDGTIGKVSKGDVRLDGKRDDAYNISGAYLPLNTKRQADAEITAAKDVEHGGNRAVPTVRADSYLVWDGEYVYVLIEIFDKTLAGRSEVYAKNGIDAWLNDGVELRYSFEQNSVTTKNNTRIGVDALGVASYALGRDTGIGGGRSTHYEEIEYAVRNALTSTGSDLDVAGEGKPSYILEFKIPAKTEGEADLSHPEAPSTWHPEYAEFIRTGRLPERDPLSNDPRDYAFTDGDVLVAGDVVRFSLQVNDLAIGHEEMTGEEGTYFWDSPALEKILADFPRFDPSNAMHKTLLFQTDGHGTITGLADTYGRFSAAGATQTDLNYYVSFSLGENEDAQSKILGMGVDYRGKTTFFADKECTVSYAR